MNSPSVVRPVRDSPRTRTRTTRAARGRGVCTRTCVGSRQDVVNHSPTLARWATIAEHAMFCVARRRRSASSGSAPPRLRVLIAMITRQGCLVASLSGTHVGEAMMTRHKPSTTTTRGGGRVRERLAQYCKPAIYDISKAPTLGATAARLLGTYVRRLPRRQDLAPGASSRAFVPTDSTVKCMSLRLRAAVVSGSRDRALRHLCSLAAVSARAHR